MTTPAAPFDLEAYLSAYRPQLISEATWEEVRADVLDAVRQVSSSGPSAGTITPQGQPQPEPAPCPVE